MDSAEIFDVKNLSSRKLFGLLASGDLPDLQMQLAEQELLLRRRHLEHWGSVYSASNVTQQQFNHQ